MMLRFSLVGLVVGTLYGLGRLVYIGRVTADESDPKMRTAGYSRLFGNKHMYNSLSHATATMIIKQMVF